MGEEGGGRGVGVGRVVVGLIGGNRGGVWGDVDYL